MKHFRILVRTILKAGLLFGAALLLFPVSAPALEITEICSSNKTVYMTETGETPDWIELYNETDETIVSDGWFLSNDEDEPAMFSLSGYRIQPQEYLVLRADGKELPFKLSAGGTQLMLTGPETQTVVEVPPLSADQTWSLQETGAWHVTAATPGKENVSGKVYEEPPFVAPPKFSHTAGFYNDPFELTLTGYGDVKVYYTTDGSIPDENATLFSSPIRIYNRSGEPNVWSAREDIMLSYDAEPVSDKLVEKCNIIRAVAVDKEGNRSKIVTNTYLVNLHYDDILVLSIVADPYALFDEDDGIYVLGKIYRDWLNNPDEDHNHGDYYIPTNFGKTNPLSSREREIPASLQLFDPSGKITLDQTLVFRIQGNYSRLRPQKSFKVIARKEISGDNKIAARLWDDLPKLKKLNIRADLNSVKTPSVDDFAQMVVSEQGLMYSRTVPCIVFLDGEYWGLYNLRPVMDEKYISDVTGIPEEDMIVFKNNSVQTGEESFPQYKHWTRFLRSLVNYDCSKEEDYKYLCSLFEIESFMRFTAANLYLQNIDFKETNNATVWRTINIEGEGLRDGRWRWMYQDMDLTCASGYKDRVFNQLLPEMPLFNALWKNAEFRNQFLNILTEFANVDCSDGRIQHCIQQYEAMYGQHIEVTQKRYNSHYHMTVQKMSKRLSEFFAAEKQTFFPNFCAAMGIDTPVYSFTVDLSSASDIPLSVGGRETLYLNQSWTGQYYQDMSVTVSVSDVPAYRFLGWYEGDILLTEEKDLTVTVSGNLTAQPRYQALGRLWEISEDKAAVSEGNTAVIPTNVHHVQASVTADDGLMLEARDRLAVSSDKKWKKNSGITITWNPDQCNNMQFFASASITEDAPSQWQIQASPDGNTWEPVFNMKLSEKAPAALISFPLPDTLSENETVYLRISSAKDGNKGSFILENVSLCADWEAYPELSEVCLSNKTAYITGDGTSPDWIELYHAGSEPMSLDGWYLSNDEDEPAMFSLSGYSIQPQEYLIIRADGKELPFKLSVGGTQLTLTGPETRMTVNIPPLSADQTYSLQRNGEWHVTAATPGKENVSGKVYEEPPFVAPPKFSHTAGFYDDPFELTLTGYGDVKVYYTTDGSVPDENAMLFSAPIPVCNRSEEPNVWSARTDIMLNDLASPPPDFPVDKCSIIRAVAIDPAGNRSKVITGTFFVGLKYENISVLSIIADPGDLFDKDDGIYVLGKIYNDWLEDPDQDHKVSDASIPANFGKTNPLSGREQEIPATYQLFSSTGSLELNQTLSIRIQGNYSRMRPQKSFKSIVRKEISGSSRLDVRLWDDLPKPNRFTVRADGNMTTAPSVDVFSHMVVSDQGQIYSRAVPVIVFLDGEYWGLYNLRPVLDERYISDYTGIPREDLIVIKNNEFLAGAEYLPEYRSWRTFLRSLEQFDFSKEEDYRKVCSQIDVDSFIRFTAAYLFLQNHDMNDTLNVTVWRTVQEGGEGYYDGRWRWVYQDMDLTCDSGYESKVYNEILPNLQLLQMLWKNESFRQQFLNTLAEFMNIDCSEERIQECLRQYENMYGPYIRDNQLRYSSISKLTSQKMTEKLRKFFVRQRKNFPEQFLAAMDLQNYVYPLSIDLSSAPDIPLFINGREISCAEKAWSGTWFEGCSLQLKVSEVPAYRFAGWYEGDTLLTEAYELPLTISSSRTVCPRYTPIPRMVDQTQKKKPAITQNAAVLPAADYQIKAVLSADSGLHLEGDRAIEISAEEKWAADTGFTLAWNSNQYANQQLFAVLLASGDAPAKWAVSWSEDGKKWTKLQQIKLQAGEETQIGISLPAALDDVNHAWLRIASDKKGGAGSLTVDRMMLCADPLNNSLANIKEYAARCRELEGDSFIPPDLDALRQATKAQVSVEETRWRDHLTELLLAQGTGTVAQMMPEVVMLTAFPDNPVYRITEEIVLLNRKGWVKAGNVPDGTAWLYRYEDEKLTPESRPEVSGGRLQIDLKYGLYVLMEEPLETAGTTAKVMAPELSRELIDRALGGMYPLGSYQLEVTAMPAGRDTVHIDGLPGEEIYSELYTYRIGEDDTLEMSGTAELQSDGSYEIPCSGPGNYLMMPESLEDHLEYAEMMNRRRQGGKRREPARSCRISARGGRRGKG